MRIILTVLILSLAYIQSAKAIDLNPFDGLGGTIFYNYPEERSTDIRVKTPKVYLEDKDSHREELETFFDEFQSGTIGDIQEHLIQFGLNKFSLGNGIVDVTFQVKNGVKYALQDTLSGYPEYQRRKTTEELLNSNFKSHKITNDFILGTSSKLSYSYDPWLNQVTNIFDDIMDFFGWGDHSVKSAPSLVSVIQSIISQDAVTELHNIFKYIAYSFLFIITTISIIQRLSYTGGSAFEYIISSPLFNLIIAWTFIAFIGQALNFLLQLLAILNNIIVVSFGDLLGASNYTDLEESWTNLVNNIGYMPALILSIIDTISQFFVYFFIAGLILNIVIASILSPIWGLALCSEKYKTAALGSLINWSKTLLVVILIPVVFMIINHISSFFSDLNLDFLQISLSIAGFIYLPALSNLILASPTGVFKPILSGYDGLINNLNATYHGLRAAIEMSHQKD